MATSNNGILLKFIGQNFAENGLNILVVCHLSISTLVTAIQQFSPSSTLLRVFTTQSIRQLLQNSSKNSFDFIVYVIDPSRKNALVELKNEMLLIDKHYLALSRVCLVMCKDVSYSRMQVTTDEIHYHAATLHAPLLVSCLQKEEECRSLAKQIVNLVCTVTGARSGVPLVLTHSQQETEWLLNNYPYS